MAIARSKVSDMCRGEAPVLAQRYKMGDRRGNTLSESQIKRITRITRIRIRARTRRGRVAEGIALGRMSG